MYFLSRRGSFIAFVALILLAIAPGGTAFAQAPPPAEVPPVPQIGARAAIVVEYPSGRILYAHAAHDRLAPASTTKILTAILAIEYGKLHEVVTVAESDLVGESSMGLVSGEQQTMHELLFGLMLPSGNDAAAAIARSIGEKSTSGDPTLADPGSRFVAMMNARVTQLGLENTHFMNPHGLDMVDHYSSAYDLASLSWYALHLPTFNEVVSKIGHDGPGHSLINTNEMLTRYPGADGIKTGWTGEGGLCLVTSATRDGKRLISIVLNAPQWYSDSTLLLDYGFAKLAAAPSDSAAQVLSVSQRGTAGWLLANSASVQATPAAPPGQGGGVTASQEESKPVLSAPRKMDRDVAPVARHVPIIQDRWDMSVFPWVMLMFGAVGASSLYLITMRLLRFRPLSAVRRSGGSLMSTTTLPGWASAQASYPQPHARTLGLSGPVRRREPNLLAAENVAAETHLDQAVWLASEGRQGASMSEFINAMRLGANIDVEQLTSQYELSAGAFLAVARAQMTTGATEDARRTLLHGVLVFPNERLLRLALSQLR